MATRRVLTPHDGSPRESCSGWRSVRQRGVGSGKTRRIERDRLCATGPIARSQCHPAGAARTVWHNGAARCATVVADRYRFRASGTGGKIAYRFVPMGAPCPAN